MIAPFYVGQEVVAVENHPFFMFKKGDEFVITFVRPSQCGCPGWEVGIGIKVDTYSVCHKCKAMLPLMMNDEAPFDAKRFEAKLPKFESITLSKILQKESSFICGN